MVAGAGRVYSSTPGVQDLQVVAQAPCKDLAEMAEKAVILPQQEGAGAEALGLAELWLI